MKSVLFGIAMAAAALPALAQTNVSISVGQPGFYGHIDVGDYVPQPLVYAPQPIIVTRGPQYIAEPLYLRVPVGHRRHWSRFCGRYNACGRQVLFVRDDWYANTYVPLYREHHGYRGDYRGNHGGGYRPPVRVVERVEYRDHGPRGGWEHGRGDYRGGHDGGHGGGHGEGRGHGGDHGGGHGGDHGGGGHGHGRD